MDMPKITASRVLLLIAVICFALSWWGVKIAGGDTTTLGLAFGFASFLVP